VIYIKDNHSITKERLLHIAVRLSNKILVKKLVAWIFAWDIESKTHTEHDVDNRHPYYQFKLKST
jgi:hypothetical protein